MLHLLSKLPSPCKTVLLEDEGQCIGNQTIIIDYEDSLHTPSSLEFDFVQLKTYPVIVSLGLKKYSLSNEK